MTVAAPPQPPGREAVEALIEEAWQQAKRRRRRRLRIALALAGIVALGTAFAVVMVDGSSSLTPTTIPSGRVANRHAGPSLHYWYTRTVVPADGPVIGIRVPSHRAIVQTWIGTDGTWRQRVSESSNADGSSDTILGGDGLFPPQTNADGSFNGVPFNPRNPGDGLFTYLQLRSLPTNIAALGSRIRRAVAAQTDRDLNAYVLPGKHHRQIVVRLRPRYFGGRAGQSGRSLMAISDLESSPLPGRLRAALFAVARSIPGVRVTPGARDALGRSGVALSSRNGLRLIFDPRTATLLAGTSGTIVARGAVSSITATPKHVAAVPEPSRLQPPRLAITPQTGDHGSTFTIRLTESATAAQAGRAPSLDANMFGPTGPGCVYWMSRAPIARITPGTALTRASRVIYTYRLSPGAIGRPAWCRGRYQLLVAPVSQPQAPRNPQTVHRELAYSAVYFTIS